MMINKISPYVEPININQIPLEVPKVYEEKNNVNYFGYQCTIHYNILFLPVNINKSTNRQTDKVSYVEDAYLL